MVGPESAKSKWKDEMAGWWEVRVTIWGDHTVCGAEGASLIYDGRWQ